jgi:ABC-2 type transport system permease protein
MTADTDTVQPLAAGNAAALPALPWIRTFYWSVRRELWEHRAIYIAPLVVAGLALAGFLFGTLRLLHTVRVGMTTAGHEKAAQAIAAPYEFVAFAVMLTGLVVAMLYCLGALYGERRDRSILFWKSLPVSDLTTVLAKAAVPLLVQPVVLFAAIFSAHLIMLALSFVVVAGAGLDADAFWANAPVWRLWQLMAPGLPFIGVWYAPLYAWLLLVSAWARRTPSLWALASPLVLALVERLALGTHFVFSWLALRLVGVFAGAVGKGHDIGWASPHVWTGLALAAAFLAGAVWLRRSREPI